jgi:aminoglycoside phosphotransferase (APT) family kinase protein
MCRKLSGYAVPDALIHGDLHGGNVAGIRGEAGQMIYFDWTDSAVSHPFFDMLLIYIAKDTAEQEKMRDVYLAHWLDFEPIERLLEVWRLAEALAAVYHAISYRYILEGLEVWGKNELDWGLPYWLRKILEHGEFIREH